MRVAIGGQGSAYELKQAVKEALGHEGHEVLDLGQTEPEDMGFFFLDTVKNVAEKVKSGECERGIVMCGTGAGVSLAANKIKGIYCVPCESVFTAERIHKFNQANVMAMGAMVVSRQQACEMALCFVGSRSAGGDAMDHIKGMEDENFV